MSGRRIVIWIIPLLALLGLSSGSALAQKAAPPPAAPPPVAPPAAAPPAAPAAAAAPYEVWVIISRIARKMEEGPSTSMTARDRKSTRLNSSHANISYAVFCLKKKKKQIKQDNR